jgi:hypothetical protein
VTVRPNPPEVPPGYRAEVTTADLLTWRLATRGRRCRMPGAAELNRGYRTSQGRKDAWWAYCAAHMYGRWIEDGRIVHWRWVPEDGQMSDTEVPV